MQLVLLFALFVQAPTNPVAGVEVTWRATQLVDARGEGARDSEVEERWTLRLALDHGLGRLDRGGRVSCLVDTKRQLLTWLDHGSATRRSAPLADGLAGLFGEAADQLALLRAVSTPMLEPTEPQDGESAAWTARFPDRTGDRWTATFAVQQRPDTEAALWKTVMRWCTAFDLDRSLWLDGLTDALPGPVTRLEIIQTARNHQTTQRHELLTVAPGPIDLGLFRAPEGYVSQPFDSTAFLKIDSY